jgi:hypothetical protein
MTRAIWASHNGCMVGAIWATHDGGMANADLSHMGDGMMDCYVPRGLVPTMYLNLEGYVELVSGGSVFFFSFQILLLAS